MRTAVRETSLNAYRDIESTGKVGAQAKSILGYIKPGRNYSLQEISKLTGYPINVVSGRCNDLKKAGELIEAPQRKCSITGRTVNPVRLPSIQLELLQ